MNDEQLEAEIKEIFSKDIEACEFINLWTKYVHMLDDVIDEPRDSERTLKAFNLAQQVYSSSFYTKNKYQLELVTILVDNSYADSVLWEQSSEEWKIMHADSLRHCAYDVFYATVYILTNRETLRRISSQFREYSHKKHLNDIIKWDLSKDTKSA